MTTTARPGRVAALARHPVKGFTPEPLDHVHLQAGAHFPGDRLYAVEDGPSGFDPEAPEHIKKMAFTVLAKLPEVAAIRTKWHEDEGTLTAWHPGFGEISVDLDDEGGRSVFAIWLSGVLADKVRGPLKVLAAPNEHRFMDSRSGFVSIINLESLRDFEAKIGRKVDPARFRGNIMVGNWPAWSELDMTGQEIVIGEARLRGLKPIERCTATHVDPHSARRDIDVVSLLREHYGHFNCGLYAEVLKGGRILCGDLTKLVEIESSARDQARVFLRIPAGTHNPSKEEVQANLARLKQEMMSQPHYPLAMKLAKLNLQQARRHITILLADAGIDDAETDARYIMEKALKPFKLSLATHGDTPCAWDLPSEIAIMVTRRARREPLSHILGDKPFWTLDLKVTPDVLTPRADTETLVETCLQQISSRNAGLRIADFGTGSGAILLALLSELPSATGLGIDISESALAIAKENAVRNGLADRAVFRTGNWAEGIADESLDIAVSNPPYIASAVLETLEPEVRDHEPRIALDGGEDGLNVYHLLLPQLFRVLKPGGLMAVEIGYDQADAVMARAGQSGFSDLQLAKDLGGQPRVISGRKP